MMPSLTLLSRHPSPVASLQRAFPCLSSRVSPWDRVLDCRKKVCEKKRKNVTNMFIVSSQVYFRPPFDPGVALVGSAERC